MKWTNTIETVSDVEQAGAKGQWRIGDALEKDLVGTAAVPGSISRATYKEAAEKLEEKGFDKYDPAYLARLHRTAQAFPRSERDERYSWDAHCEAGNPVNLKKVATALRKIGKNVTIYNVRNLMKHWRSKATETRKSKRDAAKDAKDKARKDKAKAAADKLAAKDKAARDEAEQRLLDARERFEEAQKELKANSGAPVFNAEIEIDTRDVTALERWALYMTIGTRIARMENEAKKTVKDVAAISNLLTAAERKEIADGCDLIIGVLRDINKLVNRSPVKLVKTGTE